ncbi:hypothetical protein VOLCADRAFT_104028 [Volvox carteri f. nagariensis]|uniref:RRM domain-containing protein n=1 Tax=Volvox carteri f. nagariensis TaxID=3068 RepID=D8TQS6_VOLCA|nr:uncharacterized protein VOLCADRAFT_104028 [Volvox carteri f. nagariensis]EFJ50083.1 hypothetical protein VOLCADRAFT_104028 [Volvox carteri f. nagariensis]|eukprot:XP_002948703.1 hypothetical protein VOLCADRAFT_104028 [Volvox carteri f. nagariensis]
MARGTLGAFMLRELWWKQLPNDNLREINIYALEYVCNQQHQHSAYLRLLRNSDMAQKQKVVYVSNLPYEATHDALEAAFEKEGYSVEHIELIKKGAGSRTKACGLAAVTLKEGTDRDVCCKKMDGKGCFGRPMIVRLDKFCGDDLAYSPKGPGSRNETGAQ